MGEEAIDLQTFMAPEGEDDEPEEQEAVLEDIIAHYTEQVSLKVPPEEATLPPPRASLTEALSGLAALQSYLEAQDDSTINDIKLRNALDRKLTCKSIS